MAFRTRPPEAAAHDNGEMVKVAGGLRSRHTIAAAGLIALAENPADANTALAAIKTWRTDQRERGENFWRNAALMLIGAGDNPEAVCADLGFGRTALQRAVLENPTLAAYKDMLYTPRPAQTEVA
ncbi:Uncharacterised protein [Mycobacteroides abscessus subsp. abscessus]|uniref:hypothetical protein n=1 Tax=Mycobacteroides abscessus TaxID=36809 RepID=UPI00092A5792|nr:hypothetical protein [Mycobacteroides abscessus]SHP27577.1 Uncharacterised protein [Mycobacteroides abscessus subsp. abscessus]SHP67288.1 Uncharacterised protein [Mycobacteroides abscessus subsp. abscessus]SHY38678.1 Uncharacterised protein [Mycobacteroides abscessus subsp. abscessus]SKD94842.1 Uncharacterised protein [Mycobacteroides abscessus subsp. abscessus]